MSLLSRAVTLALALLLALPVIGPPPAVAVDDVKIALVVPLSGRWARQGQLKKMGAEMAIDEINACGIGFGGGQCLSLADCVRGPAANSGGATAC